MQIFLVSIRTAKIYGPGQVMEAENPQSNTMSMRVSWPHVEALDEWEGYAVVVPERNQVWGACRPERDGGYLEAHFDFTPMDIPPKDKKLFSQINAAQAALKAQANKSTEGEEASTAEEAETSQASSASDQSSNTTDTYQSSHAPKITDSFDFGG